MRHLLCAWFSLCLSVGVLSGGSSYKEVSFCIAGFLTCHVIRELGFFDIGVKS